MRKIIPRAVSFGSRFFATAPASVRYARDKLRTEYREMSDEELAARIFQAKQNVHGLSPEKAATVKETIADMEGLLDARRGARLGYAGGSAD